MKIEVAYALPEKQWLLTVEVEPSCTVLTAIQQSGILSLCPDIDLTRQVVGVFSKRRSLSSPLQPSDRVEIYRPLIIDPKEARLAKSKKRLREK